MAVAEQITSYPKLKKMRARKQSPHVEAGGSFAEIVASLAAAGRLSQRAMMAAHRFSTDLQTDAGTSGNIAACYQERVQSSLRVGGNPIGWTQAGDRVQAIIDSFGKYEKEVLDFLIRNKEYARPGLHDWGRTKSRYEHTNSASGFAVGQISMLCERLADLYDRYSPTVAPKTQTYSYG
jgi:hypothetical protein